MMKAKELYSKYASSLMQSGEQRNKALNDIIHDLDNEMTEIVNARHVKFDRGLFPILKQQNDKWNALVRLFEKEWGASPLKTDGFRNLWLKRMPELEKQI